MSTSKSSMRFLSATEVEKWHRKFTQLLGYLDEPDYTRGYYTSDLYSIRQAKEVLEHGGYETMYVTHYFYFYTKYTRLVYIQQQLKSDLNHILQLSTLIGSTQSDCLILKRRFREYTAELQAVAAYVDVYNAKLAPDVLPANHYAQYFL